MSDYNLKIILTANGETTTLDPVSGTPSSVELSSLLADTDYEVAVILQSAGGNIDVASDSETFRTLSGDIDESTPFYLENVSGNGATFTLTKKGIQTPDIAYSLDGDSWSSFNITWSVNEYTVEVPANGRIYLRSSNGFSTSTSKYFSLAMNQNFKVCGNVMNLLNYNDLNTELTNYCFYDLFFGATNLVDASSLILPAKTLAEHCYHNMFSGCTSLTTAPELPATTLAESCYNLMFANCTSLTPAPELPATTLASDCYLSMFHNCDSLIIAPELPATTLASSCYSQMFYNCSNLTTAPELPATTLAGNCYRDMFYNCKSLTTAPELPATTLVGGCYERMFSQCSNLTGALVLPATTLADYCYNSMFNSCNKLQSVTTYVTNWDTTYTNYWLEYAGTQATNPTIYCPTDSTLKTYTDNNSGIPTGWTQVDLPQ